MPELARLPLEVVIILLVLLAALVAVGTILVDMAFGERARLKRRMAQLAGGRKQRLAQPAKRRSMRLKDDTKPATRGDKLREELAQAGLKPQLGRFLAVCGGIGVTAALITKLAGLGPLPVLLTFAIFGAGGPRLVLSWLAKRRLSKFTGQFADALDIIVRGVRSGLPLGECIAIISREMPDPVGAEFRQVVEGSRIGMSLEETLERAVERMPTPELRFFSIVITIQQQTGGNLAETLAKLSELLRSRKRLRDKVQAFASEARASAAIIGSLPVVVSLVLAFVAPAYLSLLFTTDLGNVLLFAGALLMGTGTLVMRKMINFDV